MGMFDLEEFVKSLKGGTDPSAQPFLAEYERPQATGPAPWADFTQTAQQGNNVPSGAATPAPQSRAGLSASDYLGLALEGFASGYAGKQPQGPRLLAERIRAAQRDRQLQLQQFQEIPTAINLLQEMRDNLKDENKTAMAPKIAAHLKDVLGLDFFTPDVVNEYLQSGSNALEDFKNGYEFVKLLPEQTQRNVFNLWKKNPAAAEKQISDFALNAATQIAGTGKPIDDVIKNALFGDAKAKLQERVKGLPVGRQGITTQPQRKKATP